MKEWMKDEGRVKRKERRRGEVICSRQLDQKIEVV